MSEDWKKRNQLKEDEFDKERKYVKNYKGEWALKPSYVSHDLDNVSGPDKEARRKELQAKAKEFALRQAAKSKE